MEHLKPVELQRLQIPKKLFGYEVSFVDQLIEKIIKEMEFLINEVNQLQEASDKALKEVERCRLQEETLKETLILAQKTADDVRNNARREAELIIQEARQKGIEAQNAAYEKTEELRWGLETLKLQKRQFEQRWHNLLKEQLSFLENNEESTPFDAQGLSFSQDNPNPTHVGDFEVEESVAG